MSHATPTHMRSPLPDLSNHSGSRVLGSCPLSKHLQPIPTEGSKATKARVLTKCWKKRGGKRSRKLKKRKRERKKEG